MMPDEDLSPYGDIINQSPEKEGVESPFIRKVLLGHNSSPGFGGGSRTALPHLRRKSSLLMFKFGLNN